MTHKTPITVAYGDGIGPAIMKATLSILKEAGARIDPEVIEIGEKVYERGIQNGIEDSAWDSLRRTGIFLKAPITTPRGGGFKSLNVTIRKSLGLYANVRPCVSHHPLVPTKHPGMDLVIIRENEEDLYGGIEHQQTPEVVQCLKIISRPGSERIARYAFEYARANGRKRVTCMIKDNIMKMSDGLFRKVFEEVGEEYPDIEKDHYIIDIGTAKVAAHPDMFDVVLLPNLYGDIVSDVAAEITGSVGLGGSCNVGDTCAMFEAIHGSAPDIAGKGIANPSGLLLGAVMMLVHIGQGDVAEKIHNAWLKTLEDGIHTGDIYVEGESTARAGTDDFAEAVISNLGQEPTALPVVHYANDGKGINLKPAHRITQDEREMCGLDVFFYKAGGQTQELAEALQKVTAGGLSMSVLTNRGTKVWPDGQPETFCTDHWGVRFLSEDAVTHADVIALQSALVEAGIDVVKTENLYRVDGQDWFTAAQGS